ncbi:unnamed protein product [Cyclocybe aegerita]|uniref:DUF6533 domain-containing protein n=1 Tax=Cyclocybe aegerita TaxID=1973307 RepID=A0A8S0VWB7_CYCAE|nr:unnamed protein product [Cyclocybe aegerita]
MTLKDPGAQLQADLGRSSGGAFVVLFWEWAITFDEEVELIWSKDKRSWLKWLFLFARYFIIMVQIWNRCLEAAIKYDYSLNANKLKALYSCQVIVAALSVSSLEIVLMARVYALYRQKRWLGFMLISFFFAEFIIAVVTAVVYIPGKDFTPTTIIEHLPVSFAYFGISSVAFQCIILILTIYKYLQSDLKAVPLVKLMMRDGTLAFVMLTIFVLFAVVYTLCNIAFAVTTYAWLLSAVSCTTCRLILNMQRIPLSHDAPYTSTTIQFTTIFTDRIAYEDVFNSRDHGDSRHSNSDP